MNINLQAARERAGFSQSDLAVILRLSQAQISRYEQAPASIPTGLLVEWARVLGTDLATLLASAVPPPSPIDADSPYLQLRRNLDLLEQYIDDFPPIDLDLPNQPPTPEDLKKQLARYRQKPNLVLVGRFDSGKSHLANTLMGGKFLPSQYQPATRVITFVRHIDERPSWLHEEVCILSENFWPKDERGGQILDLALLDDQAWCERHCIEAGSLEVLRQHGVHNHLKGEEIEGHSAVIYVDSPILKSCNIVDFPGYSDQADHASEDVRRANSAVQIADLILYTSPANGFINAEDLSRLAYLLRVLPAPETHNSNFPILGNLFTVATHAAPHISNPQLESILEIGAVRLYDHLGATVLQQRSASVNHLIEQRDLQQRFFAFWEETPNRWAELKSELVNILGQQLPNARQTQINEEIERLKNEVPQQLADRILAYEQTRKEVEQRQKELDQLEKEEPNRIADIKQRRHKIHQRITQLHKHTKGSFQQTYSSMIDTKAVETMIRKRYRNKKDAKEYAAGYLVEQLQGKLEALIQENSDPLKVNIEEFLKAYDEALLKLPKLSVGAVSIPFDPKGAFIGGLVGLGGVGALAVWAASLGNLGAYILVAKAVSLLSVLGISISGGVATAVQFVAAIGGPITLAIGLLAAAAFLGWALFGESWEHRLAKKIVNHFAENKAADKFLEGVDQYWHDTTKAFDKGADAVEYQFQTYIQHLRDLCSDKVKSKESVEQILMALKQLQNFFTNIPWRNSA